ncbi:MAG: class I SAM-dependent methyltransferase [Candidatus Calescibacterium sp.]|nr:class I SAM-dependent methyltransferase [Candidatus Calescibacterium sp.]MDW8132098.1 class I SAM-dependent methyltransferase [Candidatus Calescibacterium sp.]
MDYLNYNLKDGYKKINALYELNNHLMTFGLDIYWRKKAGIILFKLLQKEKYFENKDSFIYCDFCIGTGEFFEEVVNRIKGVSFEKKSYFIGLDFSFDMINWVKKKKVYKVDNVVLILADVGFLPFKSNTIDFVSISLGIRNLRNPGDVKHDDIFAMRFNEIYRVIKTGGYFWGLETSRPPNKIIRKISDFFTLYVFTNIAKIVSFDFDTYTYLAKSMLDFFDADKFKHFLINIGFKEVDYHLMTFGIVSLHIAKK